MGISTNPIMVFHLHVAIATLVVTFQAYFVWVIVTAEGIDGYGGFAFGMMVAVGYATAAALFALLSPISLIAFIYAALAGDRLLIGLAGPAVLVVVIRGLLAALPLPGFSSLKRTFVAAAIAGVGLIGFFAARSQA